MTNRVLLVLAAACSVLSSQAQNDSTVTDIDGNTYKTVTIDTQIWMVEDLKTTKYNDGTAIPLVEADNNEWSNLTEPGYCWYNNDHETYGNTYGILYNWYAVNTGKLCPAGWHVPTDAEWTILTDYLGGENVAGGKLKEAGTTHWNSPNAGATNETGFSALPGGYRSDVGTFYYVGFDGYWWSATDLGMNYAWYRDMMFYNSDIRALTGIKRNGFSVRCLKD